MLPRRLRRFLLDTQRTPLRLIYRAIYAIAIWFVTSRLRRTRGVRSVYLVGGLVEGPVYGLSDIDLVILVDDPDGYTALRVVELLAWLRTLIPMLESPQGIGVYRADDVARAARRSPLLHYRLVDRPRRLLHGPDTLPSPGDTPAPERRARALAEVGALWALALEKWPRADRNRLFGKLCASAYQAVVYAETGDLVPRARALELLGEDVGFLPADHVAIALAPFGVPEDAAELSDVLALLLACFDRIARAEPDRGEEPYGACLSIAGRARACAHELGAPALASLRASGLEASSRLNVVAHEDPLFCAAEHARVHVTLAAAPSSDELDALLRVASDEPSAHVFLCVDGTLVPLSAPARYGLVRADAHPELVDPAGLGGDGGADTPVEIRIPSARASSLREALAERRRASLDLVRERGHLRIPPRDRARLVVNAMEGPSPSDDSTIHMIGAAAACDARASDPVAAAALAKIARAFSPQAGGDDAFDCPRALVERVVAGGADAAASPPPPPIRLSVVICTRDRAALLRAALGAIAAQTRPPDEVVVVDNGSTDDTRDVVASFEAELPLVTVFLAEPSIPAARNAGARASTGDVICYTDDDATADASWLAEIEATFLADPAIGIVGGDAPAARAQRGLVPDFLRQYMQARA